MFEACVGSHARSRPDAPAIVTPAGAIGFAKFDADIGRAAWLLRDLGGDVAAIDVADPYLHWVLTLALARLGKASAPAADGETRLRIGDRAAARADVLLGPKQLDDILSGAERAVPDARPVPDALARIFLSSGTTGARKRVGISWRNLDDRLASVPIAYGVPAGPWRAETGIDTVLGFTIALGCWTSGNPLVLGIGRPMTGPLLRKLEPAMIATTPAQLAQLLDTLEPDHPRLPLRVVLGGGAVPQPLVRRARALLTDDIRSVYGTTETGGIAIAELDLLERGSGASGRVLPGVTLEIVDEAGEALPLSEGGHVRVRGARVAAGYLGGATFPGSAFADGWFHPGDLGRLDSDGLLTIEGRSDDLMNIGGQKIMPGWVEAAAMNAAGVREAAAFSLPDGDGLERCWLAIVRGDGFSEAGLAEALRGQLAWTSRIGWLAVDALPRNAMGKVERTRLREAARHLS